MSNEYWDEDDDLDFESGGNDGSDLVKKLRKAKRADEKRIKELTEQLESLSKVNSERTVKEILDKKGVNGKAARLILKDLDNVNEESVSKWLDENGDLFGIQVNKEQSAVADEDLAALRQQNEVTRNAVTPDKMDDLFARIDNAQSTEELQRIIYSE